MSIDLFGSTVEESRSAYSTSMNSTTSSDHPWWSSLRHGGCLIAPSRLNARRRIVRSASVPGDKIT